MKRSGATGKVHYHWTRTRCGEDPELRDNGKGYMMADHPVISASVVRVSCPQTYQVPGGPGCHQKPSSGKTNDKLAEF